ncbi:integrase-like protein [Streptomyces albus]|uniref:Integrase-like protein n=2 Tax=Streptomyces TaxID=1883 RepID=A0A0B5F6J2_STRA4|nr:integrase-like protein [Streptomyces albus]AOU81520.1 integrase-like protein [Streptomyces albus]
MRGCGFLGSGGGKSPPPLGGHAAQDSGHHLGHAGAPRGRQLQGVQRRFIASHMEMKRFLEGIQGRRSYAPMLFTLIAERPLKAFRAAQAAEKLAAGEAYEDSGYVLVDELGQPWKTDKLRREAHKLMATTGVRKVRLYDARHACLSWMANNGVPDTVVSAWAGHSDLGFTKRTYVHPDPQSLRAGSEKLAELLG